MGGPRVPEQTWHRYDQLRAEGVTQKDAAQQVGVSVAAAIKYVARSKVKEQASEQAQRVEKSTKVRRDVSGKGIRITPDVWRNFETFVNEGWTITAAAQKVGISENSGRNRVAQMRETGRYTPAQMAAPTVRGWSVLPQRAKRAWDDFEYFRRVYFGHVSTEWQIQTAQTVLKALKEPGESYFILSMPPGSGKSTLLVDLAAWLTVRDRTIRGLFGSRNATNARRQVRRLARALTATVPAQVKLRDLELGLGCDAEATLAGDFGVFKAATEPDTWRADEFVVVQEDGRPIAEKESTWMSYGMDSGFLGNRYDIIFWDDVVDRSTIRTQDAVDEQRAWWDEVAESRLDPGGAMFLVGQRMGGQDLYRYCADKTVVEYDDEGEEVESEHPVRMYTNIVFKAHDETVCKPSVSHRFDAPAQPVGCLLDPKRLSWKKLSGIRANSPSTWAVQYQQEDGDATDAFVRKAWIFGGPDTDELTGMKTEAPGCVDKDRSLWETPKPFGRAFHFATVDPSDRQYWSIMAWCFMPDLGDRLILLDTIRTKMSSADLLDYNPIHGYSGVMVDWQAKSVALRMPFTHWIVERTLNAQHLTKYSWVQQWCMANSTRVLEFTTSGVNKNDAALGVPMLRPRFRDGRIRLPYGNQTAVNASNKLINEVLRYPLGTTDQVMATWFAASTLEQIARFNPQPLPNMPRPSVVRMLPDGRNLSLVGAR